MSNDLYTFVAGAAVEKSEPFQLKCNCNGTITIMPPFQEKKVICPVCESNIHILIIEGDPGYITGKTPEGEPSLLPVQGNSFPLLESLTEEEKLRILDQAHKAMEDKNGQS